MSLNISETAHARDHVGSWLRRFGRSCCIAAAALAGGCQLILDDIESDGSIIEVDADGIADAFVTPPLDAASSDGDGGSPSDATQPDVEVEAAADAGVDASPSDATPDAPHDTGSPDPDPEACDGAGERIFYRDSDKDGHGDPTMPLTACEAPAGYVEDDRDCHDGNAYVFGGQTAFFTEAYRVNGTDSYDYDCNNDERGAPGFQPGQPCMSGGVLACGGGGYQPNPGRAGRDGINPHCGSNVKLMCPELLPPLTSGCNGTMTTTSEVFPCN